MFTFEKIFNRFFISWFRPLIYNRRYEGLKKLKLAEPKVINCKQLLNALILSCKIDL